MEKSLFIYLDYDGVLNNEKEAFGRNEHFRFNKRNVDSFKKLMYSLNEKYENRVSIVLNTSWKMSNPERLLIRTRIESPISEFASQIIGCTETFKFYDEDYSIKGFEVEHYIVSKNLSFQDFDHLIIDDDEVSVKLGKINIYNTIASDGLTDNCVNKILLLLNK